MERITDTHIYFWGGPLSQWQPCEFTLPVNGKHHKFNCSEQYMMAMKAFHFGDFHTLEKILKSLYPDKQKALGRQVAGFIEEEWDKVCISYVTIGNIGKFSQNPKLKKILIDTGNKIIVEASPYDKIWGIGLHYTDDAVLDENKWKGKNYLGISIMKARDHIVAVDTSKAENVSRMSDWEKDR